MLLRLILLFTITPLVELTLLIELGKRIGLAPTLAVVILTGVIGSLLARSQGLRVLRQIRLDLSAGILPGDALLHGMMILIAGAFLITPGLLTDTAGFLLLIPPVRVFVGEQVKKWLRKKVDQTRFAVYTTVESRDGGPPQGERDEP